MNIPNSLTLLRIVLVPVIVIFLMDGSYAKALAVFVVCGITDAFDGFLARFLKQQTVLGSYLDPIADKALLITCFVTLSIKKMIPGWLAVIVISRDCIILLGLAVLSMMSIPHKIEPLFISKVTTTLQIFSVFLVLTMKALSMSIDHVLISLVFMVTALFTVISGLLYIIKGMSYINRTT